MALPLVKCRYFQNRKTLSAKTINPQFIGMLTSSSQCHCLPICIPKIQSLSSLQLKSQCYFKRLLFRVHPSWFCTNTAQTDGPCPGKLDTQTLHFSFSLIFSYLDILWQRNFPFPSLSHNFDLIWQESFKPFQSFPQQFYSIILILFPFSLPSPLQGWEKKDGFVPFPFHSDLLQEKEVEEKGKTEETREDQSRGWKITLSL